MRVLTGAAVALLLSSAAAILPPTSPFIQRFAGQHGDERSCTLCLEEASSQLGCPYIEPSTPQFNFECLCLPANSALVQGCAGFCQDTSFSQELQCVQAYQPVKRAESERNEAACEIDLGKCLSAQIDTDDDEACYDAHRRCALPGQPDDSQPVSRTESERTDTADDDDETKCLHCVEKVAIDVHCFDKHSNVQFNWMHVARCGRDFPKFQEKIKKCRHNSHCKEWAKDIEPDTQVGKTLASITDGRSAGSVEASLSAGVDYAKCLHCLWDAESATHCGDDLSAPSPNYACLCLPSNFDETAHCTEICQNTHLNTTTRCSRALSGPVSLSARAAQTQSSNPGFGFCGPKGVNCKSTEYAGDKHKKTTSKKYRYSGIQTASGKFGFCGVSGSNCAGHPFPEPGQAESERHGTTLVVTRTAPIPTAVTHTKTPTATIDTRTEFVAGEKNGNGGTELPK